MSYCVNCGVKLEQSLERCPLCNTPVINPNEVTHTHAVTPFPKEKGQVEVVKRKDLAILLFVSLTATGVVCGLLNFFIFPNSLWSLYIVGACLLIGTFAVPAVIYTRMPIYISLLLDGIAVALYQFLITFNTSGNDWFFRLALPITILITGLAILFAFLHRCISSAFLMTALYVFAEAAVLCVGIQLLIQHYMTVPLHLTWSAIVLAICSVIVITLVTILSRARLRNAVRRRLHF